MKMYVLVSRCETIEAAKELLAETPNSVITPVPNAFLILRPAEEPTVSPPATPAPVKAAPPATPKRKPSTIVRG